MLDAGCAVLPVEDADVTCTAFVAVPDDEVLAVVLDEDDGSGPPANVTAPSARTNVASVPAATRRWVRALRFAAAPRATAGSGLGAVSGVSLGAGEEEVMATACAPHLIAT